ncbi:MAG: MBL fold metallo-hydrolase [Prevotella sp.]|nr:MBL fold metallo-hydrolase [Prevotella sp.]
MRTLLFSITLAILSLACQSSQSQNTSTMDTFKTQTGKEVTFHPIKHASMAITFDGREIQVDPVIDAVKPTTDYAQWPKADFILITHEHFDHLDKKAVEQLSKNGTVVLTNKNSAAILGHGEVMANGDSLRLANDIMLWAVPAYNTSEGHLQFHPKGRDNGFILELDGLRIYIAGDTEDIEEMADVKDIDIAFLPCNQPFTMLPEQMRHAVEMVKPKVLYPYHFGETSEEAMIKAMEGLDIDVRIRNFQ